MLSSFFVFAIFEPIVNKNPKDRPIGIFDSGIGGLTVANAIRKALPDEKLIYFGDTAHLPYGDKSSASIKQYSVRISEFLAEKDCKAIVIACNTASAVAFNTVKKKIGSRALVVNVIDPVVRYTAQNYVSSKIGVIGTKGTINSRVYANRIAKLNPKLKVTSLATPLLAPMIEEGFFNNNISQTIINSYLSKKSFQGVKALILACTHYPLIKREVKKYYQNNVEIIDSAEIVAKHVERELIQRDLIRSKRRGTHQFFVSDFTESFEKSTKIFFREELHLKQKRLFD